MKLVLANNAANMCMGCIGPANIIIEQYFLDRISVNKEKKGKRTETKDSWRGIKSAGHRM